MFALTDAAAVSSAVFYSSRVEAKTAQDFFENRLLTLLGHADRRLGEAEYLAGDYGVADMALYPVFDARRALVEGKDGLVNLKRWAASVGGRTERESTRLNS